MPINRNALPSPEPDDRTPEEIAGKVEHDDLAQERQDASQYVAETQQREEQEQPKRKRNRRNQKELTAAAVVPGDDDKVQLKDLSSGVKIERSWLVAVEMVKDGKAEWADKSMKYALLKYEQQKADSSATDAFGRPSPEQLEAASLPTDASGQMVAPEGSEHGDEVVVGVKTYRVGPGGALVDGVVDAPAKRRWQRELGTGGKGPWEAKQIVHPGALSHPTGASAPTPDPVAQNGDGGAYHDVTVERERLPHTEEELGDGMIKIGTGILEKIGMPQVEQFASASQFQVGPITMSRIVFDDGRRTSVTFSDGRQGEVITAAVEGFDLLDNTVEFVAARFRGQLVSFLQATGALKQPVS